MLPSSAPEIFAAVVSLEQRQITDYDWKVTLGYLVQDRLRHASNRMADKNKLDAILSGKRNGVTYRYPLTVSPILMSADEISPGNPSAVRVEFQDFGIDVANMGNLYPPEIGDHVTLTKTKQVFSAQSIGGDEPPYQHVTTSRDRILLHTQRSGRGF